MPEANKPKRMSAYVRVSRVMGRDGESYISPDVQREAVAGWAKSRGVEIIAIDVDEDQSGGTQDRPGLRRAIARIEAGESDGIAVAKLNRFARNVSGGIDDIRRIQAAGGTVAFVEEGIDPTGAFGSFLLTMLLAVAELELGNVKAGWEVAKHRALDRNVTMGPTPFGYMRADGSEDGASSGSFLAHPDHGPIVSEAFRLAAASDSIHAAYHYLERQAPDDRTWTTATVRRLLSQTVYLGSIAYGDRVIPDAHEALTTRAIFDLANRHEAAERAPKSIYTLSGFARCAGCGDPMVGAGTGTAKGGTLRTYRCRNYAKRQAKKDCPAPAMVVADKFELHVLGAVHEAGVMVPTIFSPYGEAAPTEIDATALAAAQVRAAREALEGLEGSTEAQRIMGLDRWLALIEQRRSELDAAEAQYEAASGEAAENVGETLDVLMPFAQIVEAAANEDLPSDAPFIFAKKAMRSLTVKKGRGKLDERVTIEWGDFPKDPRPDEPLTALR